MEAILSRMHLTHYCFTTSLVVVIAGYDAPYNEAEKRDDHDAHNNGTNVIAKPTPEFLYGTSPHRCSSLS